MDYDVYVVIEFDPVWIGDSMTTWVLVFTCVSFSFMAMPADLCEPIRISYAASAFEADDLESISEGLSSHCYAVRFSITNESNEDLYTLVFNEKTPYVDALSREGISQWHPEFFKHPSKALVLGSVVSLVGTIAVGLSQPSPMLWAVSAVEWFGFVEYLNLWECVHADKKGRVLSEYPSSPVDILRRRLVDREGEPSFVDPDSPYTIPAGHTLSLVVMKFYPTASLKTCFRTPRRSIDDVPALSDVFCVPLTQARSSVIRYRQGMRSGIKRVE